MPTAKYPLDVLARLRDGVLERAVGELAAAERAQDTAVRAREAAERRHEEHGRTAACARDAERAALARGELRAVDLARAEEWAAGVDARQDRLADAVDGARSGEAQAADGARAALAVVAARRADVEVVVRHRERWVEAHEKLAEDREEEAAFEAWRPKK